MNTYIPPVFDPMTQTYNPSLQPVYVPQTDIPPIQNSSWNYPQPIPTAPVMQSPIVQPPGLVYVYQPQYPIYYYPPNMPTSYVYPQSRIL